MNSKSHTTKYLYVDIDNITNNITTNIVSTPVPIDKNNNSNSNGVPEPPVNFPLPVIKIINANCFEVANQYTSNDIVIHNFANNKYQGGPCSKFTEEGTYISNEFWSNTHEDQIIKKYQNKIVLPKLMYPICNNYILNGEGLLYSVCDDLPSVITIAALQDPNYMKKQQRQTMINRIKLILVVCAKYNKNLITGLWGCGMFGGKPIDLAEFWNEALADKTIPKPKEIIFAIRIDIASSKWGSFEDMEKLFRKLGNWEIRELGN